MDQAINNMTVVSTLINKIQGRVKHIPVEQVAALETIEMALNVINIYAEWVDGLKKELIKLDNLNKSQAEMIRSRLSVVV